VVLDVGVVLTVDVDVDEATESPAGRLPQKSGTVTCKWTPGCVPGVHIHVYHYVYDHVHVHV
jgi:hypothetical protein